jgi:hypothetical protein
LRGIFLTRKNPGISSKRRDSAKEGQALRASSVLGILAFSGFAEGVVSITLTDPEMEELLPLRSG